MTKTFKAPFAQTPNPLPAQVNLTAATPVDGSAASKLLTAGVDGCIVTKITAIPKVTITATSLVLYVVHAAGGTKSVKESVTLPAYAYGPTAKLPRADFDVSEGRVIRLGAGEELWVGALVAAMAPGIDVTAEYTDF